MILLVLLVVVVGASIVIRTRPRPVPRSDRAGRLAAAAIGWLPAGRAEWGRAMLAELDSISGRRERRRFALGCVRAVLLAGRPPIPVMAAIVVVASGIGVGIGAVSPELRVFAVIFAVELAVCGWFVWLRGAGAQAQLVLRLGVLLGVAVCVALTVFAVVRYPGAGADPSRMFSIGMATTLTGYVWLVLSARPDLLSVRARRRAGFGALGLAKVWTVGVVADQVFGGGVSGAAVVVAVGVMLATGIVSGRSGEGVRAATICGLWMGIGGAVSLFAVGMISTLIGHPTEAMVSDNLGGLIELLLAMPMLAVCLTVLAATVAESTVRQPIGGETR